MSEAKADLVATHVRGLLQALGYPESLEGELRDTPERFAELLLDRFVAKERSPLRALPTDAPTSGPVVLRNLPYHALCAHHIVPFFGVVQVAYLPGKTIAGFGAFPRLIDELSRGPQLQEQLATQIVDAIQEDLQPEGVLVRMEARQMCMELTGACGPSHTIVYAARGCFTGVDQAQHAANLFGPHHT